MHQEKWWNFHEENPAVWDLFQAFTFEAINAGHKHYSAMAIIQRIRWHTGVETKGSRFKINNNHVAYYARMFHVAYPEHDGFFRLRSAGDADE